MKYKIALLIGRFQPFHLGHLYLIKKTLLFAEKIIIGIGSASIYDENNPLSYEERKVMLEKVIKFEGLNKEIFKIIPLEDYFDDKKWLENVKRQVGEFDIVVSNNAWTNRIMKSGGYNVKVFSYYRRELYEGWRIRKLAREGESWENRVPKYLKSNFKFLISKQYSNSKKQSPVFNHVVLGGTFDHLHKGHKVLLNKAFEIGKKVTIGLTSDTFSQNKIFNNTIQSYKERKNVLKNYLNKKNNYKIIPISEYTGGADKNKTYDCIIVSRLTYYNALKINLIKVKNNLKPLRITIIKDELAEDKNIISSERIRTGEINQEGKVFVNYFKKNLLLPENLREELRKPLGIIFKNTSKLLVSLNKIKPTKLIAVGDIIVNKLLEKGIDPDVKVIDFRSRRLPSSVILNLLALTVGRIQDPKISKQTRYDNPPGMIKQKAVFKLNELIRKNGGWLVVNGEEDLLTLPAILLAPLGAMVLYGHWQYGIISVLVSMEIKENIIKILKQFKLS